MRLKEPYASVVDVSHLDVDEGEGFFHSGLAHRTQAKILQLDQARHCCRGKRTSLVVVVVVVVVVVYLYLVVVAVVVGSAVVGVVTVVVVARVKGGAAQPALDHWILHP